VEDDAVSSWGCATGAEAGAAGVGGAAGSFFLALPRDVLRDGDPERPGSRILGSRRALTSKRPPVVIWKGICTSVYPAKRKR